MFYVFVCGVLKAATQFAVWNMELMLSFPHMKNISEAICFSLDLLNLTLQHCPLAILKNVKRVLMLGSVQTKDQA